ncbi:MAG: hypothetical protein GF421_11290 [Candidatus Aminicenantes bacterium]|nr:hypothetical protein [Candidatus Aminicenantes bacterium]
MSIDNMKKVCFWGILILYIFGGWYCMTNIKHESATDLAQFIPEEMNGWRAAEEDKIYDEQTIYDYIDGAGEVYNAYQFVKLRARHFKKPESPNILVDCFDMGSSRNAFGVFTHDLEGARVGIGQGSTYKGGLLSFWKDRYFISLYAERETQDSKNTVLELGREISSRIPNKGSVPEIISRLPEQGLDPLRVRYFYNPLILNYHFYVGEENLLNLSSETHAALGVYEEKDHLFRLLLIQYPDEDKAHAAHQKFIQTYMPDSGDSFVVQTEDGQWTGVDIEAKMLAVVFEAPYKETVHNMIGKIKK